MWRALVMNEVWDHIPLQNKDTAQQSLLAHHQLQNILPLPSFHNCHITPLDCDVQWIQLAFNLIFSCCAFVEVM